MNVSDSLPPKPLTHTERKRIRSRNGVRAVTSLGVTSINDRRHDWTTPATRLVVLVEATVYVLEYDESGWSEELLDTNADRQDHLEYALDLMEN